MSGFHIGRLLLSFFPRFLKAIYRRKNNFHPLPYQIMHLLPGVVSCFRPNVPNLVFYGSGNVWWSGWCAAPGIDQHWNNGPAGNTICKLDFTAYIWQFPLFTFSQYSSSSSFFSLHLELTSIAIVVQPAGNTICKLDVVCFRWIVLYFLPTSYLLTWTWVGDWKFNPHLTRKIM